MTDGLADPTFEPGINVAKVIEATRADPTTVDKLALESELQAAFVRFAIGKTLDGEPTRSKRLADIQSIHSPARRLANRVKDVLGGIDAPADYSPSVFSDLFVAAQEYAAKYGPYPEYPSYSKTHHPDDGSDPFTIVDYGGADAVRDALVAVNRLAQWAEVARVRLESSADETSASIKSFMIGNEFCLRLSACCCSIVADRHI